MGTGQELWARHRDGTEFLVEISLSPVSAPDGLCTIMAVRASSEQRTAATRGGDDGRTTDPVVDALDAGVLRPIFSASLGLHGLLDEATVSELVVLHRAIAGLDQAIKALRHIALNRARPDPAPDGGLGAAPDPDEAPEVRSPTISVSAAAVEYVIDADDAVIAFDGAWTEFARENDAPELAELSSGRQLWSYFGSGEVRELWQLLVGRVRAEQVEARVPFRCDAPSVRRWFEMTITPGDEDTVRFRSVNTFEQVRSTAVPVLDLHAERDQAAPAILLYSWCGRGHDGTRWLDLEELVIEQRLLEQTRVPPISHGSCPECRDVMVATLVALGHSHDR